MPTTVLLIEDDAHVAQMVSDILERHGYATLRAGTSAEGLKAAVTERPDIVLLDLGLEEALGGLGVCRQLRQLPAVRDLPIIVLTGSESTDVEAQLFAAGADDYLRKGAVRADLLLARIAAVLRRVQGGANHQVVAGPLRLDLVRREARLDDRPLDVTPTQFTLLARLAQEAGRVVDSDELTRGSDLSPTTLRVHVAGLRTALGDYAWVIETVRGQGLRLRTQPPVDS